MSAGHLTEDERTTSRRQGGAAAGLKAIVSCCTPVPFIVRWPLGCLESRSSASRPPHYTARRKAAPSVAKQELQTPSQPSRRRRAIPMAGPNSTVMNIQPTKSKVEGTPFSEIAIMIQHMGWNATIPVNADAT